MLQDREHLRPLPAWLVQWSDITRRGGGAGAAFRDLRDVGGQIPDAIDKAAPWLEQTAEQTLDLAQARKFEEAQQRIDVARQEIRQARRGISRAMQILLDLQSGFHAMAGAV